MREENVFPLNLSNTPIWTYVSKYCALYTQSSPAAAKAWLDAGIVPEPLQEQVKHFGGLLIDADVQP